MICLKQDCAKMAKRNVGSSLSVQRCMQCGVGGNKKLVRQLRKPQTIKEKDIYPGVCKKRHQAMQTNKQKACPTAQETRNY